MAQAPNWTLRTTEAPPGLSLPLRELAVWHRWGWGWREQEGGLRDLRLSVEPDARGPGSCAVVREGQELGDTPQGGRQETAQGKTMLKTHRSQVTRCWKDGEMGREARS